MRLKALLIVTAIVEVVTGLALLALPALVLAFLLGIQAAQTETLFVGRVAGAALLAIGVTSALARDDAGTPAQRGVLIGILLYDVLVALLLVYAGLAVQMAGPTLWPAVVLHTLIAVWCLVCLQFAKATTSGAR
jgi:phosphotransferase system  glucose/maltose/N-acetylglucosamine-specific IIC component